MGEALRGGDSSSGWADGRLPFIALMLVRIWPFLLTAGSLVIVLVGISSILAIVSMERVARVQLASAQVQLCVVLLMISPLLRSASIVHDFSMAWVMVFRSGVEMELLVLSFVSLPALLLDYTSRCAAQGPGAEQLPDHASARLAGIAEQSKRLLARVRSTSSLLYACSILRLMLSLARALSAGLFHEEPFQAKIIWLSLSLALLAVMVIHGFVRQQLLGSDGEANLPTAFDEFLRVAWGHRSPVASMQKVIAVLLLAAQMQDLVFLLVFGSERVAQIYASCLFMLEITAVSGFITYHLTKRQWSDMQVDMPMRARIMLLFEPSFMQSVDSERGCEDDVKFGAKLLGINCASGNLAKQPRMPCWRPSETEAAGLAADPPTYVRRSIWRGVLFDTFSPFVRSRMMPVLMLTLLLDNIYVLYPLIYECCLNRLGGSNFTVFVTTVVLILVATGMWFVAGMLLIGNNPFVRRSWLWLAVVGFVGQTVWNYSRFSKSQYDTHIWAKAHLWLFFFSGGIGAFGCFLALRAYFQSEGSGDYHRGETDARTYVAQLLGAASATRKMLHAAWDLPPLLLAGAVATVPVVLSLTFFAVYIGRTAMHFGRLAQVFALAAQGEADHEEVFAAFDVNFDQRLARAELGLPTLLYFAGVPELTKAMSGLWAHVDTNGDGRLDLPEAREFLTRIFAAQAALTSWLRADSVVAGEELVVALDADPKDGALSQEELPTQDVGLVLKSLSPELADVMTPEVDAFWNAMDVSGDGKLNANELANYIARLKERLTELRLAVRIVCAELVQAAARSIESGRDNARNATTATDDRALASWKERERRLRELHGRIPDVAAVAAHVSKHLEEAAQGSRAMASAARGVLLASIKAIVPPAAEKAERMLANLDSMATGANVSSDGAAPGVALSSGHTLRGDLSIVLYASSDDKLADLDPSLAAAMPEIVAEVMPTIQDYTARALFFLDLLEGDPDEGAKALVEALDESGDGRVDADELGLSCMLGLVSPSLATWAEDLVKYAGGEKGFGERGLARLLHYTQKAIHGYVGDRDGDGKFTRYDLVHAAGSAAWDVAARHKDHEAEKKAAAQEAARDGNHSATEAPRARALLQVTGVLPSAQPLQGGFPGLFPEPFSERGLDSLGESGLAGSLLQRGRQEHRRSFPAFMSGPAGVADESWFSKVLSEYLPPFVHWAATVDLTRIEGCFFAAVLLSMMFGFYIVANTFIAHVRIFTMSQANDYSFRGGKVIRGLVDRPDFSTFYPGMLFSTVLIGMITLFPLVLTALLAGTSSTFWHWMWLTLKPMIIWLAATWVFTYAFLRLLVLDWYCMQDGEVVNPRAFSCVWVVLSLVNFAIGALGAVSRFFFIWPFAFVRFHQLDRSLLGEGWIESDFGTVTFLTTVRLAYEDLNPIRRAFVGEVMPGAHRLYGLRPSTHTEPRAYPEPRSYKDKGYSKTMRNKWWLLRLLSDNPSLAALRVHRLQPHEP